MPIAYHRSALAAMHPAVLYRLLTLRVAVFVVEQSAAYPDLDGRDAEPGAELLWAQEGDAVLATARVLREPAALQEPGLHEHGLLHEQGMLHEHGVLRIGRVATAVQARSRGVASELMRRAIERCTERDPGAPVLLGAQTHLAGWYGRFGFAIEGPAYEEDGIPHVPMRRTPR